MAKNNAKPGMGLGTRYDQPDSIEIVERKRFSPGFPLQFTCPVCRKHRRSGNHDKCSRLMQKQSAGTK